MIHACYEKFDLNKLKLAHGGAVVSGLGLEPICSSALVTAYSKLDLVDEASKVFYGIPEPDLVLWNIMILAYGNCGLWYKGHKIFIEMQRMGKQAHGYTLVGLLLGLEDSRFLNIG